LRNTLIMESPSTAKENCNCKLSPEDKRISSGGEAYNYHLECAKNPNACKQLNSPSFERLSSPVEERCQLAYERKQNCIHKHVARVSDHHEHIKRAQRQISEEFDKEKQETVEKIAKKEEMSEQCLAALKKEQQERIDENNRRLQEVKEKADNLVATKAAETEALVQKKLDEAAKNHEQMLQLRKDKAVMNITTIPAKKEKIKEEEKKLQEETAEKLRLKLQITNDKREKLIEDRVIRCHQHVENAKTIASSVHSKRRSEGGAGVQEQAADRTEVLQG